MTRAGEVPQTWAPAPGARLLLGLAAAAVAFAAADTYVVVLALPDMMSSVGLAVDELQRAAPIVSGFLLGYVAMLPLIGRIADLRGRVPVLVGSLVVFALGSLVTAAAYDLPSMVAGRFLQGVGGGGLVPATLALVADMYPPSHRGVPLGVVGAVQELGSVVGPLYGALVLAAADWEEIFWINLAVGLVLAAVLHRTSGDPARVSHLPRDPVGAVLAVLAVACLLLVMLEPDVLAKGITTGLVFLPIVGESRWLSPLALTLFTLLIALLLRCWVASAPLLDLRQWGTVAKRADLVGAGLLALSLSGIILAFASADPEVQVFSPAGPWMLAGSAVAAILFWWRNRRTSNPLIPRGAFARTPAWGALLVSFFVGAALIAALVDIPIFARVSVYPDSQLMAALVLVRLLVALPVGAVLGGYLTRRVPAGVVTAAGMGLAAGGFAWMAQWGLDSLEHPVATVPLVMTGLGFGLALAPVNAALLAATEDAVHGVTSAMLVVARMVGMLVGISALTTIGLRRYYAVQVDLAEPSDVCGARTQCAEYTTLLKEAGLAQLQTVFLGAAVCALVAAAVALLVFHHAQTRGVSAAEALRQAG
ncbi:MAG TPA: MFS transporter [Nocardioidaceae bacterium]|nr:MFS transporter [Nocardioidaceae bacterium]